MLLQLFKWSKGQIWKKDPFTKCINESGKCVLVMAMKHMCIFTGMCWVYRMNLGLMSKAMVVRWSIKDEKVFRISIRKLLKGSRTERKKFNFHMNVKWTNTQKSYCSAVAFPSLPSCFLSASFPPCSEHSAGKWLFIYWAAKTGEDTSTIACPALVQLLNDST